MTIFFSLRKRRKVEMSLVNIDIRNSCDCGKLARVGGSANQYGNGRDVPKLVRAHP